jgi:hypothetical protein
VLFPPVLFIFLCAQALYVVTASFPGPTVLFPSTIIPVLSAPSPLRLSFIVCRSSSFRYQIRFVTVVVVLLILWHSFQCARWNYIFSFRLRVPQFGATHYESVSPWFPTLIPNETHGFQARCVRYLTRKFWTHPPISLGSKACVRGWPPSGFTSQHQAGNNRI